MATENDFADFVRRQRVEKQSAETFDPAEELENWLGTLSQLYSTIESYLATYVSSGDIQVEYQQVELNEEFSGPYKAKQMTIKIGHQQVTLKPVGTMLIGSRGRVDVLGASRPGRLGLNQQESH